MPAALNEIWVVLIPRRYELVGLHEVYMVLPWKYYWYYYEGCDVGLLPDYLALNILIKLQLLQILNTRW